MGVVCMFRTTSGTLIMPTMPTKAMAAVREFCLLWCSRIAADVDDEEDEEEEEEEDEEAEKHLRAAVLGLT